MTRPLRTNPDKWLYRAMIGTGGIGSGSFFAINGNRTLGREESRSGHYLDQNDYCKLHIISHYVQTLLGQPFRTIPVGMVGEDNPGRQMLSEMRAADLDVRHVSVVNDQPTLFSFCFLYPDGSGGNMTTDNSACDLVNREVISKAEDDFRLFSQKGVVLAVPEVPLDARERILELGTDHQFFRVAAFTSEEMQAALDLKLLVKCDHLAINMDEAASLAGMNGAKDDPKDIIETAIRRTKSFNPELWLSITDGRNGSWFWNGAELSHQSIFDANLVSSAGAGDAHLAGVIVGLVSGLNLKESHELAALVAGLSVTSQHTINKEIGRDSLRIFAQKQVLPVSAAVQSLLIDTQ